MMRRVCALALSLMVRAFDLLRDQARRTVRGRPRRVGVVLYYHAIKAHQRERFASQMDELLHHGRPAPAGSPEMMTREGRNVAITFDDGFQSVVENAAPELTKRQIPFTIFVPSGCLGERPSWVRDPRHPSWQERVLSAAELRLLAGQPLATIGSHSVTHSNLVNADAASAARELVQSKADLEAAVKTRVELFSFPHGAHAARHLEQARQAGYRRVFTIEPSTVRKPPYPYTVGRVAADPDDWPIEFRLKLSGAYRWRCYLHQLRKVL